MIIDCILDRKDREAADGVDTYNAKEFYLDILAYHSPASDHITKVMDIGNENDIKIALCHYILTNGYNATICGYVLERNWLTNAQ